MSKKYTLHKITKKEAEKLAEKYFLPQEKLQSDCYCMVNKKGKPFKTENGVILFNGTMAGKTDAEQNFKRNIEACVFFEKYAAENDISFKIPKMDTLLTNGFNAGKLKYPDLSPSFITADWVTLEAVKYFEKVDAIFDMVRSLKEEIPELTAYLSLVPVQEEYDEYEEDYDDYEEDEYEDEDEYLDEYEDGFEDEYDI